MKLCASYRQLKIIAKIYFHLFLEIFVRVLKELKFSDSITHKAQPPIAEAKYFYCFNWSVHFEG